jgi:tripartite-type tricarboxylate transporter receptor subunit TctC
LLTWIRLDADPPRARRLSAALATAAPSSGRAASWPERPLRWLVGFPPGGAPDLLTRILAQRLEPNSARRRGGEPARRGRQPRRRGARPRRPDGLTFGTLFAATLAVNRHVYRNLPFDPRRDFALLSEFARFPSAVMVHPSVPVSSVAELGAWMRAQGGAPDLRDAGRGRHPPPRDGDAAPAAGGALRAGPLPRQPRRAAGPGGRAGAGDGGRVPDRAALVRDGRARAVAVTSARRSPLAPELPAVAETLPGFETASWLAVGAPAGLPEAIAARMGAAVVAAARDPDTARRFAALGAEAIGSTREELAARIAAEDERWGELVRAAGITAD